MRILHRTTPLVLLSIILSPLGIGARPLVAQDTTVLRVGSLIDGRGGVQRNVTLIIEDGRVRTIENGVDRAPTYDLSTLTVLPGLIDTHVHIGSHFGRDGRATNAGESDTERMLHAVENAYVTLMAGFTTVQSIGSASDLELRDAIARGVLPGPRLLTSISPVTERTGNEA